MGEHVADPLVYSPLRGRHERLKSLQDPAEFDNFNSFFTRALVPGTRPLTTLTALRGVSCWPEPSELELESASTKTEILQAKGKHFTVTQLLTDRESHRFVGGSFACVYLSCPVIITGYICRSCRRAAARQSMCRASSALCR